MFLIRRLQVRVLPGSPISARYAPVKSGRSLHPLESGIEVRLQVVEVL
jgi:hypothetical protein